MKRFLYTFGNVLLTILVMLLIVYGWAFVELKIMLKSNPEIFGYVFYQQKTDNMKDDFNVDDIVIIKKNDTFQAGDIVMFLTEEAEYKVEKVVRTDNLSTTTKCNTCIEEGSPIDNSTVIGRAVGKIAYLGKFINFFKRKEVLVVISLIGFACVIASQYIQVKPAKKVASGQ